MLLLPIGTSVSPIQFDERLRATRLNQAHSAATGGEQRPAPQKDHLPATKGDQLGRFVTHVRIRWR